MFSIFRVLYLGVPIRVLYLGVPHLGFVFFFSMRVCFFFFQCFYLFSKFFLNVSYVFFLCSQSVSSTSPMVSHNLSMFFQCFPPVLHVFLPRFPDVFFRATLLPPYKKRGKAWTRHGEHGKKTRKVTEKGMIKHGRTSKKHEETRRETWKTNWEAWKQLKNNEKSNE